MTGIEGLAGRMRGFGVTFGVRDVPDAAQGAEGYGVRLDGAACCVLTTRGPCRKMGGGWRERGSIEPQSQFYALSP